LLGHDGDLLFRVAGCDGEITVVIIGVKDGVVELCVSVEDTETLAQMYPEHLLMQQVGDENIGWTYDGVTFTAPQG
jgi:hypothetical protein